MMTDPSGPFRKSSALAKRDPRPGWGTYGIYAVIAVLVAAALWRLSDVVIGPLALFALAAVCAVRAVVLRRSGSPARWLGAIGDEAYLPIAVILAPFAVASFLHVFVLLEPVHASAVSTAFPEQDGRRVVMFLVQGEPDLILVEAPANGTSLPGERLPPASAYRTRLTDELVRIEFDGQTYMPDLTNTRAFLESVWIGGVALIALVAGLLHRKWSRVPPEATG